MSQYKQSGVDIAAGDAFSQLAGEIARSTYKYSRFVDVQDLSQGNFRGPRGFVLKNLPEGCMLTAASDGIGTKTVIIDAARGYAGAASNPVAMTAMDITRYGGLPLALTNTIDVRSLGEVGSEKFGACRDLMAGLGQVCRDNGFVLLGGETAELGTCVGSENENALVHFNWTMTMIGVYHPGKMILGNTLRPGQIVMALRDGFRSNGFSLVRKAFVSRYGKLWWNNPAAMEDILAAGSPSTQYDLPLNKLHGWYGSTGKEQLNPIIPMHLIVHLSGGAIKSKFANDMLGPQGLSAVLDNLFEPPEIMQKCALWQDVSPQECYESWNGGQGALVVIDECNENIFTTEMKSHGIEVRRAGMITEQRDYTVALVSKFGHGSESGQEVYY